MSSATIEDDLFGKLSVVINDSCVTVCGDRLPEVVLRRKEGATINTYVPIGTRDPAGLSLSVDGSDALISPRPGKYSRRSYRVTAEFGGARYLLTPASATTSRLLRDGQPLGDLSTPESGQISAEWTDINAVGPTDAAIGYALAASFGAGARLFVFVMLEGIVDAGPG
ncbi:hypothetical protein [Actinocrispum sp. NPDC049592]|uniref:hypothetical protein n=1 Tax=Actinocrispum sp. NPDC049592 TaxID=3154835 RepID=UPI0034452D55